MTQVKSHDKNSNHVSKPLKQEHKIMFQIKIGAGLKTIEGNLEVNQRTNNLQDEFLVKRHSVSVISYESETTSFVRPKLCEANSENR